MTKKNDDLVPVKEFITASPQNLEIATAIYEQYTAAREQILKNFFERLGKRLMADLPGWGYEYGPPFFTDQYGVFRIFKDSWKRRYEFVLEAYRWGERMNWGVWRREESLNGKPRSPEILAAVKKAFPAAKSRVYYEAEIPITSPATDWQKPDVLWRLHSDREFLREVEGLFKTLIEIAEGPVDKCVKSLRN